MLELKWIRVCKVCLCVCVCVCVCGGGGGGGGGGGCSFVDDILRLIFLYEIYRILIPITLATNRWQAIIWT